MKKVLLALSLLVFAASGAFAQQQPQFSHYMFNGMYLSPGYAGVNGETEFNLLYRYQWLGYDASFGDKNGSPRTGLFSASIPISSLKSGIGVHFVKDNIAATDVNNGQLSYSYHKELGEGKLGIGVQGSIFNVTKGTYRPQDISDPRIPFNSSDTKFDAGAGVWYHHEKYYGGLGVNNLLGSKYMFENETKTDKAELKGARHVYATAGYNIQASYNVVVTPTAIAKYDFHEANFEVGARATVDEKYYGGLGYRHNEAVTALLGMYMMKDNALRVGYAFDLTTFDREAKALTSHEIMVAYRLPKPAHATRPPIKTPRYSF